MFDFITSNIAKLLENGKTLYLHGGFHNSGLRVFKRTSNEEIEIDLLLLNINAGESDTKIFQLLKCFQMTTYMARVLIISLDTDVKFLSIVFSSLYPNVEIFIKSGKTLQTIFSPGKVVSYISKEFSVNSSQLNDIVSHHARNLLKTYILFSVDQNPGFHRQDISHSWP